MRANRVRRGRPHQEVWGRQTMDGDDELVGRVLTGETRAIARLMSIAEGRPAESAAPLAAIHKHAGNAHIVGLTGVLAGPGGGVELVDWRAGKTRRAGRWR